MSIANIGDLNLADRESMGYTFKTMGAGFWALRQTDFRYVIESLTLEVGMSWSYRVSQSVSRL